MILVVQNPSSSISEPQVGVNTIAHSLLAQRFPIEHPHDPQNESTTTLQEILLRTCFSKYQCAAEGKGDGIMDSAVDVPSLKLTRSNERTCQRAMGTTMDFACSVKDFGSTEVPPNKDQNAETPSQFPVDVRGDDATLKVDAPRGILKRNDSSESYSSSPGSSDTSGDSLAGSTRSEDQAFDSDSDSFIDCGHDDFPFCPCLNEKVSCGPGFYCDHDDFPFCDCLSKAVNRKQKKAFRFKRGEGRGRRRGYDIGATLSAFRDSGLEVFDETEESDFQESETEAETPRGLETDADSDDTEGVGPESEAEGAVGYSGKDAEEGASVNLLVPPGLAGGRKASIVTCDSRRASVQPTPEPVKIAVFGTDGVGKSETEAGNYEQSSLPYKQLALIVRLLTGRFIGEYDPTMEAVYSYQIPLPGHDLPMQVMDTAGHVDVVEEGREAQVSWGEGFMLVFSLTSHISFTALSRLRRVILELTPGAPRPMVLVGNKADLSHAREVNDDEIRDWADCWGCDYFEVAAPEPWDVVVRPFTALYQSILEARACQ